MQSSALLIGILFVASPLLFAADAVWNPPQSMTAFMGNPQRGPEPNPKLQGGRALPPHQAKLSKGHPLHDYGHFRLNKRALHHASLNVDKPAIDMQVLLHDFQHGLFEDGSLLQYQLLQPAKMQQPREGWPLVILCPGSGGVGKKSISMKNNRVDGDTVWITPLFRKHFPAFLLRMHPQQRTVNYGQSDTNGLSKTTTTPVFQAYMKLIDHIIATYPINTKRVYILGFSMGGSTTWELLHERPEFFAAAAPAAGSPAHPKALPRIVAGQTPIWMFMGNNDPWSGSAKYIFTFNLLQKLGHKHVRFWEIQDIGHANPLKIIPVAHWLFQQKRP